MNLWRPLLYASCAVTLDSMELKTSGPEEYHFLIGMEIICKSSSPCASPQTTPLHAKSVEPRN